MEAKIFRMQGRLQDAYSAVQTGAHVFRRNTDIGVELPISISQQAHLILNEIAVDFALKGDYEKAVALLCKIIHTEQKLKNDISEIDYHYFVNRGDCYRAQHLLLKAIRDYSTAIDIAPKEEIWEINTRLSLSCYLMSIDQFNIGDFASAESSLNRGIEANPKVRRLRRLFPKKKIGSP